MQINVLYKGFFIYFNTLVSSKLIVSKEKDLDSIAKSAIKSFTWHAAIVKSFGRGRKNNMKNSLMSLNHHVQSWSPTANKSLAELEAAQFHLARITEDKEKRLKQLASPASPKGYMRDMIKSYEITS